MMQLKISSNLSLPIDAVTQTFAILAKKRRGKTYTASVLAEEMIKAKLPFVALDPTGAWWGLRASADGKKAGYPVIIIGGEHGDIPITPDAGTAIADLVIDLPNYYIIDMSQMNSNADQDRFATDFGERLYRAKAKKKFPMMLFVDEADCFVPQKPYPNQMRMLGAYDTIVRRGGIRGIGVCLISQRPAIISKNVLYMVECLIVLQVLGKHDRDTIEGWVKQHGAKAQCEELMDSLASLDLGEGWLWSPAWLDKFERIQVRKRETFNSSKTPEVGEEFEPPKVLAPVDIENIRSKVAATIDRAEAQDADRLFKKLTAANAALKKSLEQLNERDAAVKELETKLANRPASSKIKTIEVPSIGKRVYRDILKAADRMQKLAANVRKSVAGLDQIEASVNDMREQLEVLHGKMTASKMTVVAAEPLPRGEMVKIVPANPELPIVIQNRGVNGDAAGEKLSRLQRVILHVLASYGACRIERLGILAGYAINGTFYNALGALRTSQYIDGDNKSVMSINRAGMEALGPHPKLPSDLALLQSHWITKFGKLPGEILSHLIANPKGSTIGDIAAHVDRQINGTFYNALGTLRTAGVIVGSNKEVIRASEDLLG